MANIINPAVMPFWEGGAPISAANLARGALTNSVSKYSLSKSSGAVIIVRIKFNALSLEPAIARASRRFCFL